MIGREGGAPARALLLATSLLTASALLVVGEGSAEVRRVEAVGVVSVDPNERGRLGLRDRAIQEALREAVFRVARELLFEAEVQESSASSLERVLGAGMVRYTTRFRILEDQAERPALFGDQPGLATEYVVIVEVYVDVDRVEVQLRESGLLAVPESSGERSRLLVEAYGLVQYRAYQAFAELVAASVGARSTEPLSFERGRALLAVDVETSLGTVELLGRLQRLAPEGLEIELIELDDETLSVSVTWSAPEPGAPEAPLGEGFERESPLGPESLASDYPWGYPRVESRSDPRR